MTGVHEFDHRFELEDLLKRAGECERLGRENSMPFLGACLAPVSYGEAHIQAGNPPEGIAPLKAGIAVYEATAAAPGAGDPTPTSGSWHAWRSDLGGATLVFAKAQSITDYLLVAPDGGLNAAALVVAQHLVPADADVFALHVRSFLPRRLPL